MMTLSILTVLGLVLLKLSLNVLHPRQWTLQQSISDAYMTYETAYAERVTFDTLTGTTSPWPIYPTVTNTAVVLGRLPGGTAINGTISRTRAEVVMTDAENPAAMKIWKAQSVLTYRIGRRTYVKSRTILRSQ